MAFVLGASAALGLGLMAAWPPLSRVEAGVTAAYPDLHPVDYRFSAERVFAGVLEVAASTEGVSVEASDSGLRQATILWPGPIELLDVRVAVRVQSNGDAGAIVFVASELVSGRADFGQNARVIRALLASLDANLALARAEAR